MGRPLGAMDGHGQPIGPHAAPWGTHWEPMGEGPLGAHGVPLGTHGAHGEAIWGPMGRQWGAMGAHGAHYINKLPINRPSGPYVKYNRFGGPQLAGSLLFRGGLLFRSKGWATPVTGNAELATQLNCKANSLERLP